MRKVQKPWGEEIVWAETSRYAGKILIIEPGHRLSRQFHQLKEETIYVVGGKLRLELGEGENMTADYLTPGQAFHVTPGTIHRFCAETEKVVLFEVSTPELDDVVRLQDDYSR